MKKYLLIILLLVNTDEIFAQPIPRQSIEDSVIGWMKIYNFKGSKESKKIDDKLYSTAQLSVCDSFANWIQASYIPRGGLGDVIRTLSEKLGLYNQNTAAQPQRYGAFAKTYTELKYNGSRKMERVTNSHLLWRVIANGIYGSPADALCTPTQYYFTLPSFEEQGFSAATARPYDLSGHPILNRYPAYFQRNSITGNEKSVLLCRDNKSPFIKITKGEYLQIVEAAVARLYSVEKKKISDKEKNNQRGLDYFMKYLDDKNDKRILCLKNNKEKYKDRLNETAEIFTTEPDAMLENFPDVFEGAGGGRLKLPVYKIDPAMAELCKKDQPQWIVVTWTADIMDPVGKHLHESVINNFNFSYVYDFAFDPGKVKGQPYKPLHPPRSTEMITVTASSGRSQKNTADENVYFFEDFSSTPLGKKPVGWKTNIAQDGTSSVVTKLNGLDGNWSVMAAGYSLTPVSIKKPLPRDFTLSYELVAAENFTWGAKGIVLNLAKETTPGNAESYVRLKLRPGFDGSDGEAAIETKFPSGYLSASKWTTAPGFSNNKRNNLITVTITKKNENLQFYIDKNKIAEFDKAIPAGLLFNNLSFSIADGSGANDKFYLGNIKISKQ